MAALPVPRWREALADLLESAALSPPSPSPAPDGFWAQLATTRAPASGLSPDLAGRPAVRTVNLRGLRGGAAARDPGTPTRRLLWFISDARSDKAADVVAAAGAEVVLFFPRSMSQVRCSGLLSVEGGVVAAEEDEFFVDTVWGGLSGKERCYFAWPPPGRPRACAIGSAEDAEQFDVAPPEAGRRPGCFRVCVLDVDYVECLDLAARPPTRTRYSRGADGAWAEREVNP